MAMDECPPGAQLPARQDPPEPLRRSIKSAALLLVLGTVVATLCWTSVWDNWLAREMYQPSAQWARFLRSYGAWTGGLAALGALGVCLWPGLWRRQPLLYRSALVLVLTTLLGAGLLNQIMIKDVVGRPRPRESVLLLATAAPLGEIEGNSMPAGHAGMAGVLVAPYFVLRRKKPRLAKGFLIGGLLAGNVVGASRMVLGAHFFSDVVMADVINLAVASVLSGIVARMRRVHPGIIITFIGIGALAMVLGNVFRMTLTYTADEPFRMVSLPCTLQELSDTSLSNAQFEVNLSGYGAPLSQLSLVNDNGTIRLRTWLGLYHGLRCDGIVRLPAGTIAQP